MKHIIWQSEWKELVESFNNRCISIDLRGGPAYEYHAAMALEKSYKITMDKLSARHQNDNPLSYAYRLRKNKIQGDAFIKSRSVVTHSLGRRNWSDVEIGIIHHIYLDQKNKSLKGRLSIKNLQKRLRELDLVVAVSQYWAEYFKAIGCENVKVIYNAFDLDEFIFTNKEITTFLKNNDIYSNKPLIHIGYAKDTKGVVEVFNALKKENYNLVMTGPLHNSPKLPIKCLFLGRKDYLRLLKGCDLVITMSKVREGWCRVAHEALLCRTPVVGSGSGGMKELLEGAGQIICKDISTLPELVKEVFKKKEEYSLNGYKFARRFNYQKFSNEWNEVMKKVFREKQGK